MLNLKKTAVAVLAFGSSAAFAGTMGPVCTANPVTVPCETTGWDLGIYALYLQPTYTGGLGYYGSITDAAGTTYDFTENDPRWQWGFKLEGSYHFSTGNDLNLNWYHLGNRTTSHTYTGSFAPFGVASLGVVTGTETVSVEPRWDAVNLEFGQHVDFGEFKNIRFHGGVQYARVKSDVTMSGTGTIAAASGAYSVSESKTYNGFGPRIGADMSYDWGNGFAVYANGAAALLVGTSKSSISTSDTFAATSFPISAGSVNNTRIIPEFEAKLGAMYTYAMAQGDLSLDVGWMWVDYLSVHHGLLLGSLTAPAADADFAVQGPYIGLKWVGTVV